MAHVDRHGNEVKITRLPPGQARNASDLARWRGRGLPKRPEVEPQRVRLHCDGCRGEFTEHIVASSSLSRIRFRCRRCGASTAVPRPQQQRRTAP
jgi:hypothetical protein